MPKSHDAKPRNKHRRDKWQSERTETTHRTDQTNRAKGFIGPLFPMFARKQSQRRRLRRDYEAACKAQREFEAALRASRISWRALEKAVLEFAAGQWARIDPAFLANLYKAHGYDLKEAA
jgi:hypothetical protein